MKLLKSALLLLLSLVMLFASAAPLFPVSAAAEEAAFAPISTWLNGRNPAPAPYAPSEDGYLPNGGGYVDESLSILIDTSFWTQDVQKVETQETGVTRVLSIRVKLSDVSQFRTALAGPYPSKQTANPITMLRQNNGVLGVNGDFFSYHSGGVIYRNGRLLRNNVSPMRELLIICDKGDFHYLRPTTQANWDEFIATGCTPLHTFWFGPALITEDGAPVTEFTNNEDNAPWSPAQRMVIGQVGELEYLILCCEGPESQDFSGQGFTLVQMAQLCAAFGMDNAYNLDGGSSANVVFNGDKINSPSNPKRRVIGDIIYFATLVPDSK